MTRLIQVMTVDVLAELGPEDINKVCVYIDQCVPQSFNRDIYLIKRASFC